MGGIADSQKRFGGVDPNRVTILPQSNFGGDQAAFQGAPQNNQVVRGPSMGLRQNSFTGFMPFGFNPLAMNRNITNFVLGMNQQMVNIAMNPFALFNQFQANVNGQRSGGAQGGGQGGNQFNPEVQGLIAQRQEVKNGLDHTNADISDASQKLSRASIKKITAQAKLNNIPNDSKNAVKRLAASAELDAATEAQTSARNDRDRHLGERSGHQKRLITLDAQIANHLRGRGSGGAGNDVA